MPLEVSLELVLLELEFVVELLVEAIVLDEVVLDDVVVEVVELEAIVLDNSLLELSVLDELERLEEFCVDDEVKEDPELEKPDPLVVGCCELVILVPNEVRLVARLEVSVA